MATWKVRVSSWTAKPDAAKDLGSSKWRRMTTRKKQYRRWTVKILMVEISRLLKQNQWKLAGAEVVHAAGAAKAAASEAHAVRAVVAPLAHLHGEPNRGGRFGDDRLDPLGMGRAASVVSDRSGGRLSSAQVLELMAQNTVLTAVEAKEYGLAHHILSV
jgi:hypothetical protein